MTSNWFVAMCCVLETACAEVGGSGDMLLFCMGVRFEGEVWFIV